MKDNPGYENQKTDSEKLMELIVALTKRVGDLEVKAVNDANTITELQKKVKKLQEEVVELKKGKQSPKCTTPSPSKTPPKKSPSPKK
nr:unnamed protein product [Meloidogyne enterolobii]CAD2195890.1 unnamed protein product [Meloidogyne enterolobii]